MTSVPGYVKIGPYDFSSIVYREGVDPSGGEAGVEEISVPGRRWADIRDKGREAKQYRIRARSQDRDEIETFLEVVNTSEEDDPFYPFDAQRFGEIAAAHAGLRSPKSALGNNFYEAEAIILCREPWLYGPNQGFDFANDVALNAVSSVLENLGNETAPIRYLQASGDYVSSAYVEDLSLRITPGSSTIEHDREVALCEKMLRDDLFEMGWRGEVYHSWETDFGKLWTEIALDLHSKTSGGSITDQILTLDNSDYLMIPFYGPLPVSGEPQACYLELYVTALTGDGATCQVALETDLSDIAVVDHDDLVVGKNIIYIPDLEGESHVAIGIKAATSGSVSLSSVKGMIKRYVAPSEIPSADPLEEFKIRVESTAGTQLAFLEVNYNDRYYY